MRGVEKAALCSAPTANLEIILLRAMSHAREGKRARRHERHGERVTLNPVHTRLRASLSRSANARHAYREYERATLFNSNRLNARHPSLIHRGESISRSSRLPYIVFDVNETLLNLQSMEPVFARIFGDKHVMRLWFTNLILYSAALTIVNFYVPFTDIGAAVMQMMADTRNITITEGDKQYLNDMFATMPPYREVPGALRKLRAAGFTLCTLTDNTLAVQTRQLENGGIVNLFNHRFSADGAGYHKPSPHAYAYVERQLKLPASRFCLIACHTWDTMGAISAGWDAALIRRPYNDVLSVGPQPHILGDNLDDVANQLIRRYK